MDSLYLFIVLFIQFSITLYNILFFSLVWCSLIGCLPPFEEYKRLWEQNEELGLNDIDTSSADAAYNSTDTKMGEKSDM